MVGENLADNRYQPCIERNRRALSPEFAQSTAHLCHIKFKKSAHMMFLLADRIDILSGYS